MNEKEMKDRIVDCFDKVAPLPIQEQEMLNNILKHKKEGDISMKQTRKFARKKLIAAIAAVVILATGTVAAVEIFWSDADVARQLIQGNEIVVNGVIIDAPLPYLIADSDNDEEFLEALSRLGLSMVMVPFEPIVNALGIDVTAALPAEIEERDGYTFVPLTFFRDELDLVAVYVFEGQVVIENRPGFEME